MSVVSLLIDYFSRTHVVNLPSRADRRDEMTRELAQVGMQFSAGRLEIFPAVRPSDPGGFESIGARGCFMSHLEILRGAQRAGAERVLIMEDDLAMSPRLRALEGQIVEALSSQPWGLVYLGHFAPNLPVGPSPLVRSDERTIATHFYGVSASALGPLVAHLEAILERPPGHPDGGPMHYDGALTHFRRANPGLTLFTSPSLGWQRSSRSDIAGGRWFDRVPVMRDGVAVLRRVKSRLKRAIGGERPLG